MKTQRPGRTATPAPKKQNPRAYRFELVQCQQDEWQAFLKGHAAPLSDHVPLNRALEVVSDLAAICPQATIRIVSNNPALARR